MGLDLRGWGLDGGSDNVKFSRSPLFSAVSCRVSWVKNQPSWFSLAVSCPRARAYARYGEVLWNSGYPLIRISLVIGGGLRSDKNSALSDIHSTPLPSIPRPSDPRRCNARCLVSSFLLGTWLFLDWMPRVLRRKSSVVVMCKRYQAQTITKLLSQTAVDTPLITLSRSVGAIEALLGLTLHSRSTRLPGSIGSWRLACASAYLIWTIRYHSGRQTFLVRQ